jgi:hypothetical protein
MRAEGGPERMNREQRPFWVIQVYKIRMGVQKEVRGVCTIRNRPMSKVLNINVGLLGHVDSGKTSLVKALSTTLSTAALDKVIEKIAFSSASPVNSGHLTTNYFPLSLHYNGTSIESTVED